jgi:RNA polymerase subunit RPABC4/transcription elongation factor Spt4
MVKMDFFDKLGKKASETYKVTAEKTGKIAKEAKLKMKINEDKSNIEDIYKEIGKKVYEKHVREEDIDIKKELEEECTKIDVLSAEIEEYFKECLGLKDLKQCKKCSSKIEKDAKFCPDCGEEQDVEEPAKEVEVLEETENIKEENIEENAQDVQENQEGTTEENTENKEN